MNRKREVTKPELVSPAGSPDAGYAALYYGADAIYLGLEQFSARADAENFTVEQADEITAYAHSLEKPRKVYVAVNTLILNGEMPQLVEMLAAISDIGADAVIVQDWGAVNVVRTHFPKLRLHASTQMAVHNVEGVRALAKQGFARVILARELTMDEVRECSGVPRIETEAFVHGALCYSMSGLCLASSYMAGRSGNRGKCAQCCRNTYYAPAGKDAFLPFSMKDLAVPRLVGELEDAGVTAFKVEGRKKNALYVAAVTDYYRKLIDGAIDEAEAERVEEDIRTIFSRPWTELYLGESEDTVTDSEISGHRGVQIGEVEGVRKSDKGYWVKFRTSRRIELHDGLQIDLPGRNMPFGFAVNAIRVAGRSRGGRQAEIFEADAGSVVEVLLPEGHPDIPEGAAVYCSSSQAVKQRYEFTRPKPGAFHARVPVDMKLTLKDGGADVETSVDGGDVKVTAEAHVEGAFQPAREIAGVERAAKEAFRKLGDTRFELRGFTLENPKKLFVPISQLNEMRRTAAAEAEKRYAEAHAAWVKGVVEATEIPASEQKEQGQPAWSIKVDGADELSVFEDEDWEGVEEVVVEAGDDEDKLREGLYRLEAKVGRERIRIALPPVTRDRERKALRGIIEALKAEGWTKWEGANVSAREFAGDDADFTVDWPVYVVNNQAAKKVMETGARKFVLSPEDGFENMKGIIGEFPEQATVIVYQDTPLFVSETCVMTSVTGECPGRERCSFDEMELVSSHGQNLVALNKSCRTVVVDRRAYSVADKLGEIIAAGARHLRASFVNRKYEPEEVRRLWRMVRSGQSIRETQKANFERGLA